MAACRSCGASIVFATTELGRVAPFQRDPAGRWTIDQLGIARQAAPALSGQLELGGPAPAPRYTSHFARCKHAAQWRRR